MTDAVAESWAAGVLAEAKQTPTAKCEACGSGELACLRLFDGSHVTLCGACYYGGRVSELRQYISASRARHTKPAPDNQPEAVRARRDAKVVAQSPTCPSAVVEYFQAQIDGVYASLGVQPVEPKYTVVYTATFVTYRDKMLDAIIARQVAAGGVDTEGTRAEAERWCAMLAGCICEGMRATTAQSALRLKTGYAFNRGDCYVSYKGRAETRGKPLGRP